MNIVKLLTTSDVAKAAGVGRETMRFYEEKGLVKPLSRTAAGYRQYAPAAVALITFIKDTQQAGFSLNEIQELLALRTTAANTCNNVGEALQRKVDTIAAEIESLRRKQSIIESMAADCCRQGGNQLCALVP
jgi:MerR family copper efflux transcriptional regulator